MARQVRVEEVTKQEPQQDCGCGCGGSLCGTARHEVILVGFPKAVTAKESNTGQCDCGCECCS